MSQTRFINPPALRRPPGYTHVVEVTAPARIVYIAGRGGSRDLVRRDATGYFFTTTISGLSFAARLWTTSALPFALALSLRAR